MSNPKRSYQPKEQRISQIHQFILEGARSVQEIAGKMQVSRNLVRLYMKGEGIRFTKTLAQSLDRIRNSIENGANCLLKISTDTGLTEKTIERYCYDYKIKIPRKRKPKSLQIQRIRDLKEKGLVNYLEDVSHYLGLSVRTAERYCYEEHLGIKYRNPKSLYRNVRKGL